MTTVAFRNAMEAVHSLSDPEPPWQAILATARDLIGADAGALIMFGKEQELPMFEQTGNDEAARRQDSLTRLDAIQATFAGFGEATFLATRKGAIWRLSLLAEDLLRSAKMISRSDRSLTHPEPAASRRLRLALGRAFDAGASVVVTVPVTWGETYRLDIAQAHPSIKLGTEQILFVRMHKNSAFVLPEAGELCAAFGLTPAEGRVLRALVAGQASNDHAAVAGVAERTVRNQIAALMRKMGCNRQSELVRLGSLLC